VTDKQTEKLLVAESRPRTNSETLHIKDECKSNRRKNSDVVDSIGNKLQEVCDVQKTATEVDDAVGEVQRPTNLDMKPTANSEQNRKQEEWKSTHKLSREEIDASPCTTQEFTHINSDSSSVEVEVKMSVDWDAREYNMQHRRRGHAVIFNHDTFETDHYPPREGSKIDVMNLRETFSSLLFDVTVHDNLEYSEIKNTILKLAAQDHSDADCLVVIIMTHGENGLLAPRDSHILYNVDLLWTPFTADKCPTLAGKPKLFFIQACRGRKLDGGIKASKERRSQLDSNLSSFKIPTHADFLIAHSSIEGFYSFRNKDTGSWFIQSLCKELNATDNLLQILTRTTWRVTQLESDSDMIQFHAKKQVPSITSMLTRDLYFHPKS